MTIKDTAMIGLPKDNRNMKKLDEYLKKYNCYVYNETDKYVYITGKQASIKRLFNEMTSYSKLINTLFNNNKDSKINDNIYTKFSKLSKIVKLVKDEIKHYE